MLAPAMLSRKAPTLLASGSRAFAAQAPARALRLALTSSASSSASALAGRPSTPAPLALRGLHSSARALDAVKVPELAESITEGTLKQWLKQPGDYVKEGEEIASVETDKIDVSINAPVSGTLTKTLANPDDNIEVGHDIAIIEPGAAPEGGASSAPPPKPAEEKPAEPAPQPQSGGGGGGGESKPSGPVQTVNVPSLAESITEGTLKQWLKQPGEYVKEGEEVASIETDKIDVGVNSPVGGVLQEFLAKEGETVEVEHALFKVQPADAPSGGAAPSPTPPKAEQSAPEAPKPEAPAASEAPKPAAPSPPKPAPKKQESSAPAPAEDKPVAGSRAVHRVKMNRMRLRIAERLKQSQNTAASLTTFNEIDMSSLMAFRARHKDAILKNTGVKLGFMSAFSKASALALKEIPAANAQIEGPGLGDTIAYHDYVDLSVAVSTPKGLVTPVVRNIESMSLVEIEQAIAALGVKARDGKLTLEDMQGGTFTISNGGVFGSLFGTPILNLPGASILGMHGIKEKPVAVNGKVEIRPIMVVALTYDHRLLDGREAVTFLVKLKNYLEDLPSMLI